MFGHALAPRKTLVIINRSTDTKSKCLSTMTKWQSSFLTLSLLIRVFFHENLICSLSVAFFLFLKIPFFQEGYKCSTRSSISSIGNNGEILKYLAKSFHLSQQENKD